MDVNEYLIKAKGFIEDAIDLAKEDYKHTKGRKERFELRCVYEELVKMDTTRCGFRRFIKLN
ncbi:MAG: hypothetical protein ACK5DE_14035 [Bacteroidota bacterium]|jgi:hypothetical protein